MQSKRELRIFKGATAIVTGAASGIGRALTKELARRGCEVVLADMQIEMAQGVALQIQASGGKARAVELDVTEFPAVELLIRKTMEENGRLDYIFNNAGITIGCAADCYSIEDWNKIIDINLRGVVNGVQAAYKVMIEQGFGHIVNTASMAALMPSPGNVSYATTKYAVLGLSQSLCAEAAGWGIRVSVLCPGVIRTPILEGGKYGKILMHISKQRLDDMWERLNPMSPDVFAKRALKAVAKNEALIIIPSRWKLIWWLNRFSPFFGMALAQNIYQRMQK